jgi:hypothetical protein
VFDFDTIDCFAEEVIEGLVDVAFFTTEYYCKPMEECLADAEFWLGRLEDGE